MNQLSPPPDFFMFTNITRLFISLVRVVIIGLMVILTNLATAQQWSFELQDRYLIHEVIELTAGGFLATGYILDEYDASPNAYLLRLDKEGNKLWDKEYILSSTSDSGTGLIALSGGGFLIFGEVQINNSAPQHREVFRLWVDATGEIIRQENTAGIFDTRSRDMLATTNDTYVTTAVRRDLMTNEITTVITQFAADHSQQWQQVIEGRSTDFGQLIFNNDHIYVGLDNGEIAVFTADGTPQPSLLYLPANYSFQITDTNEFIVTDAVEDGTTFYQVNTDGDIIFSYQSPNITDELRRVIVQPNGDYILYGSSANGQVRRVFIERIDATGTEIWSREITQLADNPRGAYNLLTTRDGGFLLNNNEDNDRVLLVKTDSRGLFYTAQLRGDVLFSLDADCANFTNPQALAGWVVTATNDTRTFYAITDDTGAYKLPLDLGDYLVTAIPPVPIWELCLPPQQINITSAQDTVNQSITAIPKTDCPHPTVQLSVPYLRRCFANDYSVSYCNRGAVPISNSEITITFDPFLEVVESSLPWSSITENNTYTFPVGDIAIGECRQFSVRVLVNCDDTELGQAHCTEAIISPIERCPLIGNDWSGSNLEVDGTCEGDSIQFIMENVGVGATDSEVQYFVIEDDIVMLEDFISFDASEMVDVTVPAQLGKSYRLEVKQEVSNPYATFAAAEVYNCNGESDSDLLFNEFDQPDEWDYIDIDCHTNIGAFDPNDKQAFPMGFSDLHLIEANTSLEYHIRFQNTGTDTAFTVLIKDTIDQNLKLESLEVLTSSHDYEVQIRDDREVNFIFDNILLPDSIIDEPGSHGFIRFLIEQEPDLADDTRLENRAGIYFDFNEPVITNRVFHTIGTDFIEMISSTSPVDFSNIAVQIAPHPLANTAVFQFAELPRESLDFQLFNSTGQLLRQQPLMNETLVFQKQQLTTGLYFFQLVGESGIWFSGKLVVK